MTAPRRTPLILTWGIALGVFAFTVALRTVDISTRFWLLEDQIRDWTFALGPFRDLPLLGPPTHVGGYTIGPAFYWILWLIRVVLGPWFENLPHAGGIGLAALQSAADALLTIAIWRRTGSLAAAVGTIVLVTTSGYDLCLAGLVWNPIAGSALAKAAIALALLDWHRGSIPRALTLAGLAWAAVHAYTGTIYVAVAVFVAMLLEPALRKDARLGRRNVAVIAGAVGLLQLPWLIHQVSTGFRNAAMGAVSGSIASIVTGQASPEIAKSLHGYAAAVEFMQVRPWEVSSVIVGWVLVAAAVIVALRWWRDPTLVIVAVVPGALAIVGYALFLAPLDNYYYLSLLPSAVVTVVLAWTALPLPTMSRWMAAAMVVAAVALVPMRYQFSATLHRMPEYGVILRASREMVQRGEPLRAIQTTFDLQPTADPAYLYRILGGQIDRNSPWIARINTAGGVAYVKADGA